MSEPETKQWEFPEMWNNTYTSGYKDKKEGKIGYDKLRSFSVHYSVARSAIDYLKTKVQKLHWDVRPIDDTTANEAQIKAVKQFFKKPLGHASTYRDFIDAIIEDYLVIGAFSLEKIQTRNGQFLGEFNLVDPATIKLLIDESGRTPIPPLPAYRQYIRGQKVADLTTNDLLYVKKNGRSSSPYGLSPLESLIVQTESALQGALYSLRYFSDGTVPEGFGEVPQDWSVDDIKKFQTYFDNIMAGNAGNRNKIKMVPNGFKYTPAKKPDDIGYDRFELWLLQQTCSVFGVPPQDLGFTHNTNRSTGETQQELGQERGMRPLAELLQEVFTRVIQEDFGFENIKFVYTDVDPVDLKTEMEIQKMRLELGIDTLDEVRHKEGKDPLGVVYFASSLSIVGSGEKKDDQDIDDTQKQELKLWRKQSINAVKQNKSFKKFVSQKISDDLIESIYTDLKKAQSKEQVVRVFDPYLDGTAQVLKKLENLANALET